MYHTYFTVNMYPFYCNTLAAFVYHLYIHWKAVKASEYLCLGLAFTRSELRSVLRRMSLLAGGTVDQASFFEALEVDLPSLSRASARKDNTKSNALLLPMDKLLNIVRRGIMDNYGRGSSQVGRKVEALFADYDPEKFHRVNKRDFSRVMLALKVNLLEDEIDALFENFSADKFLNYRQFLKSLALDDSPEEANLTSRPIKKLMDLIRKKMAIRFENETVAHRKMLQIFREMDTDNRSKVDRRECLRAFALLKVDLHPDELETLFEKFDLKRDNLFSYKDFIEVLYPDSNPNLNSTFSSNNSGSSNSHSSVVVDLLDRLSRELQAKIRAGHLTAARIRKILSENSSSSSSVLIELSRRDFYRAMRALNCEHSSQDFDRIFDHFDASHGNQMSGDDFLSALGLDNQPLVDSTATKHSAHGEKLLNFARKKVEDSVGSGLHAGRRLKDMFLEVGCVDRRLGLVDRRQFTRTLALLKVDLTSREIDALFDHFDTGRDAIPYNEFISALFPSGSSSGGGDATVVVKDDKYSRDMLNLMDSIRRKLEDYGGSGSHSAKRIKEIFAEIDVNNSGDIDKVRRVVRRL